nr:MAG TPA: hypothetical protein [Caudoviricetes sp.]
MPYYHSPFFLKNKKTFWPLVLVIPQFNIVIFLYSCPTICILPHISYKVFAHP